MANTALAAKNRRKLAANVGNQSQVTASVTETPAPAGKMGRNYLVNPATCANFDSRNRTRLATGLRKNSGPDAIKDKSGVLRLVRNFGIRKNAKIKRRRVDKHLKYSLSQCGN